MDEEKAPRLRRDFFQLGGDLLHADPMIELMIRVTRYQRANPALAMCYRQRQKEEFREELNLPGQSLRAIDRGLGDCRNTLCRTWARHK